MKEFEGSRPSEVAVGQIISVDNNGGKRARALLPELSEIERGQRYRRIAFNGVMMNKLLANLPGPDFARLLPHLEAVSLASSQVIYGFGDSVTFAYFPETAVITHLYVLEDGSATAAALIGNEGMIGLSAIFAAAPQAYATQIAISGNALRIDIERLREEFKRGGAMQQALLKYTTARLAQLSQKAVCNGRHCLDARFCTWLLMLQDRAGQNRLPLTHEQIAHHLGARRAGITAACNTLRRGGIIQYRRGSIRISNRQLLEAAACECYRAFRPDNHVRQAASLSMAMSFSNK